MKKIILLILFINISTALLAQVKRKLNTQKKEESYAKISITVFKAFAIKFTTCIRLCSVDLPF